MLKHFHTNHFIIITVIVTNNTYLSRGKGGLDSIVLKMVRISFVTSSFYPYNNTVCGLKNRTSLNSLCTVKGELFMLNRAFLGIKNQGTGVSREKPLGVGLFFLLASFQIQKLPILDFGQIYGSNMRLQIFQYSDDA